MSDWIRGMNVSQFHFYHVSLTQHIFAALTSAVYSVARLFEASITCLIASLKYGPLYLRTALFLLITSVNGLSYSNSNFASLYTGHSPVRARLITSI
jgi:hypothetical protein